MSRSAAETLVRLLGLYYLAEGGIAVVARVLGYMEYLAGDQESMYPKGYFWSYFYAVFPLLMGVLLLMYSKQLAGWIHRDNSVASDD